ncbi:unnamed protein product [Fraxinus pennsylvanica]|uniref:Ubiquitin-like domain-containing protein n=1 Tax=Fraxinus pennsylvanica TaxID=56036 RepID=A0AAD2A787_9LAMI|nr:unnamed protein product [Fraxinus pennsylvanica]
MVSVRKLGGALQRIHSSEFLHKGGQTLGFQLLFLHKDLKFSIKSFRVPELYIEVPETATVGSLKRMVMEVVTAILGSGLQVGVVLQGKKVRDDNRTLQHAGISQSSNLDSLGFALEPSFAHVCGQRTPNDLPLVLQCDADLLSSRIPFSLTEVEALVEAVEKLRTGRCRNVKMRAFEDADHRTYVDLKDKWKTLVHTASIARQQRRGEPVPQELLDRVLAAHAYWSRHQPKHGKHKVEPLQITYSPLEMVGA